MNDISFADLEDLDANGHISSGGAGSTAYRAKHDFTVAAGREAKKIEEACPKCRGSGRFISFSGRVLGNCFRCEGKGKILVSKPLGQRLAEQAKRSERNVAKLQASLQAFEETNPAEHAYLRDWMRAPQGGHGFLADLWDKLHKYGFLTEGQLGAVQKRIAERAEKAQARAEADAQRPAVDVSRMSAALDKAHSSGLKRPFMLAGGFRFARAPDHGKNPGAIYVTIDGSESYLGKLFGGKLFTSRECSAEQEQQVLGICADPLAAAVAYGKATGVCSCCGRELTNEESISLGIGPVCRRKYF